MIGLGRTGPPPAELLDVRLREFGQSPGARGSIRAGAVELRRSREHVVEVQAQVVEHVGSLVEPCVLFIGSTPQLFRNHEEI